MKIFQTILLIISMENYKADAKMMMVFSLACYKHAKGFGESALLGLQVLQVFNNERVILLRGKHFGALPSRLLAALAKQNKRFVSSGKHVERTTTWRKKSAIPFTIVSRKNYEIFHERAKQEEYFSKNSV